MTSEVARKTAVLIQDTTRPTLAVVVAKVQIPDRDPKGLIVELATEVPAQVEETAKVDVGRGTMDVEVSHGVGG